VREREREREREKADREEIKLRFGARPAVLSFLLLAGSSGLPSALPGGGIYVDRRLKVD